MAVRLGVIADDLTGANDTGVQFARQGARTVVPLDWHGLSSLSRRAEVLVLNTDSRRLMPAVAAQRAKLAAAALRKARVPAIYKKIDSTFRGNISAELDGILDVYPTPLVLLVPSFPPAGRAVINGILTVDGVPVHRTAIGRDPITPVPRSHLPTLLREQSVRRVRSLSLDVLRDRWPPLSRVIHAWQAEAPTLVVADASTAGDLRRIAHIISREGLLRVVAGSAGLAAALGPELAWPRRKARRLPPAKHPILLVVGSPNPTSLAQIEHAQGRGGPVVIRAEIREILAGSDRFRHELNRVLGKVRAEISAGRDALLALGGNGSGRSAGRAPARSARGKRVAALSPCASATLSEFLGRSTRDLTRTTWLGGLVLCGGDIALAACRALGAEGIALGGEVEPGVPWGQLIGGERPNLPVITKAGGFGTPEVFPAAIRFLKHPRVRSSFTAHR